MIGKKTNGKSTRNGAILLNPNCVRGLILPTPNSEIKKEVGFQLPTKDDKVVITKLASGLIKIKKKGAEKKKKEEASANAMNGEGHINWEMLEKNRKRLPCEKLLKQMGIRRTKKKNKKTVSSDDESEN
jgi:hypothetical protein